ncbi:MAG: hypothetical protein WCO58_02045 [bacterium]
MFDEITASVQDVFGSIGTELGYIVKKLFSTFWKLLIFIFLSVLFIPSFVIVTWCTKRWNELLGELFGL